MILLARIAITRMKTWMRILVSGLTLICVAFSVFWWAFCAVYFCYGFSAHFLAALSWLGLSGGARIVFPIFVAMLCGIGAAWFVWVGGSRAALITWLVHGAVLGAALGFCAGFPFAVAVARGPSEWLFGTWMIGLFLTGPAGFLCGVAGGLLRVTRARTRKADELRTA